MNIIIRECLLNELGTLHSIGYKTFDETFRPMNNQETMDKYLQESFSKKKLAEELRNKYSTFFFIYLDNELVGYLKINDAPAQSDINDPDSVEVERIYIRKEHKGKGLGTVLMEHVFQQAEKKNKEYVWLGVWEKNVNAITFYEGMGFKVAGQHSFQIGKERQSDLIMKKIVNQRKNIEV